MLLNHLAMEANNMFIRPQQDLKSPNITEQLYRAIIVNNNDPNKLGRVQARIKELHGTQQDLPDVNLPWAMQMRPVFMGGGENLSTFSVPRIGSEVIITHIKGDIYQPAYIFELNSSLTLLDESAEDYPESYGFKDSDGNKYYVNMEQDTLKILFNGDQFLEITKNRETIIGENDSENIGSNKDSTIGGNNTQTVSGNNTQTTSGNFTINVSGNCNVTSGGPCTVTAPSINLNGSSAGVLTQESINPLTGTPFPSGSSTVFAGNGNG